MAHEAKVTQRRVSTVARRALVWGLRVEGLSLQDIAKRLLRDKGITVAPMTIQNDIKAVFEKVKESTSALASDHRTLMLQRIELAIAALMPEVLNGTETAIHALVRLMERESKLIGADAPAKIDISHRIALMAREKGYNEDEAMRIAEQTYQEQKQLTQGS